MDLKNRCIDIINAWNAKNLDALKAIYGKPAIFHDSMVGKKITGDFIIQYAKSTFFAFPDLKFKIQDMAIGDNVGMIQWTQCGTNTGDIMKNPATGNYIVSAVSQYSGPVSTAPTFASGNYYFLKGSECEPVLSKYRSSEEIR